MEFRQRRRAAYQRCLFATGAAARTDLQALRFALRGVVRLHRPVSEQNIAERTEPECSLSGTRAAVLDGQLATRLCPNTQVYGRSSEGWDVTATKPR
jgi:hypothetical protein